MSVEGGKESVLTFGHRLAEYQQEMGFHQHDLSVILDKSRQRINAYIARGETPDYADFIHMAGRLGVSLDWLAGLSVERKWNDAAYQAIRAVREAARDLRATDVYDRTLQVIGLLNRNWPLAQEEWFLAGLLGLGETGLLQRVERYRHYLASPPSPAELHRAVLRLSHITGLSTMWLQLGELRFLDGSGLG